MTVLSRYVLRRIALPFAVTLGVVLFALVLERLLEITRTVTDRGAPVARAVELIVYLLPHYLGLAVPAALFLGVLAGLHRLRQDRELHVMHAAGVPLSRLLRPVVGLSLVLALFVAANAAVLQPYGRHAYRVALRDVAATPLNFRLQPGTFYELGDDLILRGEAVTEGGTRLDRVFAGHAEGPETRTLLVAQSGVLTATAAGAGPVILFRNGTLIRMRPGEPPVLIDFDRYAWPLPAEDINPYGPRGQDERELTLAELWLGASAVPPEPIVPRQLAAELHSRLIAPVSVPLLALLAAPLAAVAAGRTERLTRFVIAIVLLVLYEKLLTVGAALVADGTAQPLIAQWGVVAIFAMLAWTLLRIATNGTVRSPHRPGRRRPIAPVS